MKKFIVLAVAGLMAVTAPAASAQHRSDINGYRHHAPRTSVEHPRDFRRPPPPRDYRYERNYDYRRDARRGPPRGYYGSRPYYYEYGRYNRGDVYPYYGDTRYVIRDYHRYGLPAPRRGYQYYEADNGEIIMAAIAGGIIGLIIGSSN